MQKDRTRYNEIKYTMKYNTIQYDTIYNANLNKRAQYTVLFTIQIQGI